MESPAARFIICGFRISRFIPAGTGLCVKSAYETLLPLIRKAHSALREKCKNPRRLHTEILDIRKDSCHNTCIVKFITERRTKRSAARCKQAVNTEFREGWL